MEPAIRSRFSLDVPWENPSANEKRLLRQLLQVIYDSSLKLPSGERLSFLQECTQKIEDVLVSLSMETKEDDEIIDQHNSSEGTPDPQTNIITPDAMNLSAKTSCIIKEDAVIMATIKDITKGVVEQSAVMIVGGGGSAASGISILLDEKGRYKPEYTHFADHQTFLAEGRERGDSTAQFLKSILDARERPRNMLYTLINALARNSRIAALITSNFDLLEIMDDRHIPSECKQDLFWKERGSWMSQDDSRIIRTNGALNGMICSKCESLKQLTTDFVLMLLNKKLVVCEGCVAGQNTRTESVAWIPDFLFGRKRTGSSNSAVTGKKTKRSKETLQDDMLIPPDRWTLYSDIMAGKGLFIGPVVIIGPLIANFRLLEDIVSLGKMGYPLYYVSPNEDLPAGLAKYGCRHIQTTAEDFATKTYNCLKEHAVS